MKLPIFNIRVPIGTSWEELREQILKAIEEERRKKTPPSILTTLSGEPTIEMPSTPSTAAPMICGDATDWGLYLAERNEEESSQGVESYVTFR